MAGCYNIYDIGGCGCGCLQTFCVHDGCSGAVLPGVAVTVKTTAGATVGTGTTGAGGCAAIDIGAAGTYNVTYSLTGYQAASQNSASLTCGGSRNVAIIPNGFCFTAFCCLPQSALTLTQGTTAPIPGEEVTLAYSSCSLGWTGTDSHGKTWHLIGSGAELAYDAASGFGSTFELGPFTCSPLSLDYGTDGGVVTE